MSILGSVSGVLDNTLDKVGETWEKVAPYFLARKDIPALQPQTVAATTEVRVERERYRTIAIGMTLLIGMVLLGFLRARR